MTVCWDMEESDVIGETMSEINIKYSYILQESGFQYGTDGYYVILSHLSFL